MCTVLEWVTVSGEHNIYVVDVGLTPSQCDELVATTEQVCKGQYAAYTYAKQTLGCREYPVLAHAASGPVHTIVHAITNKLQPPPPPPTAPSTTLNPASSEDQSDKENDDQGTTPASSVGNATSKEDQKRTGKDKQQPQTQTQPQQQQQQPQQLQLDDREPHIVKYDVTRKERQKLDMHTDKSEWTFLIALSNGCGVDYEGGGTYFECLDATVHIQRGHALIFPGKLRHCGQKITSGLRFLLVGFLVDRQDKPAASASTKTSTKCSNKDTTSSSRATTAAASTKTSEDISSKAQPPSAAKIATAANSVGVTSG